MGKRLRQAAALGALLAVLLANGFHVVALKGYAWTGMIVDYQATLSLAEAIEVTFSEREMCGVCLTARGIQESMDETLEAFLSLGKPLLLLLLASVIVSASIRQKAKSTYFEDEMVLSGCARMVDPPPPRPAR